MPTVYTAIENIIGHCNIYTTLILETIVNRSKSNYSRGKNNCEKIQPTHTTITKRNFILRGNNFCGTYNLKVALYLCENSVIAVFPCVSEKTYASSIMYQEICLTVSIFLSISLLRPSNSTSRLLNADISSVIFFLCTSYSSSNGLKVCPEC